MTETVAAKQIVHRWYARPVFFVADVNRALRFYIDMLGFEKAWHSGDGTGTVCQVNRGECEIILCEDAAHSDKARLFVELTAEGLEAFRQELVERARALGQQAHAREDLVRAALPREPERRRSHDTPA